MKATIGLDAGHGGSSSGTYSVNTAHDGLFEKDFALEMVLKMRDHLERNGFKTVLTRETDINPGNVTERAKKMAEGKADFAFSLHFNGFGNESANGTEVYVPYKEKAASIEAGFFNVLTKYFKNRAPFARSNSYYDRNAVFDKRLNLITKKFDAVTDGTDYFGFIRNCWANGISADLLEICFLTNPKDFATFQENKDNIARELAKVIVEAYGEHFYDGEIVPSPVKPRIKRKFDVIN